jgi:L-asparaginase
MLNPILTINIITTGGTIEKSYDELDGILENRASIIRKEITDHLRIPYRRLEFFPLMSKDSLHMTDEDRRVICKKVHELVKAGNPVVVLHGTDTMAETAQLVHREIPKPGAAIIFTGAMRPIGFETSDALQNVTEAIFAASIAEPGIYISFHSRLMPLPNVRKNRQTRTFESY